MSSSLLSARFGAADCKIKDRLALHKSFKSYEDDYQILGALSTCHIELLGI
jgi:hypothetical protein